jgi:hypothetical protein
MAIELKRSKGGRVSPEQAQWLRILSDNGWRAVVCHGAYDAINEVKALYG